MFRKITIAGASFLLIMALFIGFLACDGDDDGSGGGSANIGEDELVQKVLAAEPDVDTVSFTMDMDMSAKGESMGESFSMSIEMSGDGAMDNSNKKMKMDMDMNMKMDMGFMGDMDIDTDMEIYIIDDITYTKTGEMMGMPAQWIKMEMPGAWEQQDMVSQQTDLLEAAKLDISDGGKVNGVSTYKVKMTPDMRDLYEILMSQQGISEGLGGSSLDADIGEMADMIKDFSVVQWYAKDTYFPMKAELSMKMEMTDDMMGMGGGSGEMDMDMSMIINFKDYNESVSISLPSDAKNAMDMSDMMDFGGDWEDDWDMDDFDFDEDDFEDMFGDMDWDDEDWNWGN